MKQKKITLRIFGTLKIFKILEMISKLIILEIIVKIVTRNLENK